MKPLQKEKEDEKSYTIDGNKFNQSELRRVILISEKETEFSIK